MAFVLSVARTINLATDPTARPSTPAKVYTPDAPRSLYVVGVCPDELSNLDPRELVRLVRREAA